MFGYIPETGEKTKINTNTSVDLQFCFNYSGFALNLTSVNFFSLFLFSFIVSYEDCFLYMCFSLHAVTQKCNEHFETSMNHHVLVLSCRNRSNYSTCRFDLTSYFLISFIFEN